MSAAVMAFSSMASTTLRKRPAEIADTAAATARSHWGAVRLPSAQRTPVGMTCGAGAGSVARARLDLPDLQEPPGPPGRPGLAADRSAGSIVVSHALPSL